MTIAGFKETAVSSKIKSVQYMLRRNFQKIKGDFSLVMDMTGDLPADNAFPGAADIQLVTQNGTAIASAGLIYGWIKRSARAIASIGKVYLKSGKISPTKRAKRFALSLKTALSQSIWGEKNFWKVTSAKRCGRCVSAWLRVCFSIKRAII